MNSLKRKCIATYKVEETSKLIRVVKLPNNKFEVDSKSPGRGAYIVRDIKLFDKVKKQKLLNKAFKTQVPESVYEELKKKMEA